MSVRKIQKKQYQTGEKAREQGYKSVPSSLLDFEFEIEISMAEEFSTGMAMVPHAISTKKRPAKNEKLCLQDYIHLLHSRHTVHLTINQLNQVPFHSFYSQFQFQFQFSHLFFLLRSFVFTASRKFIMLLRYVQFL